MTDSAEPDSWVKLLRRHGIPVPWRLQLWAFWTDTSRALQKAWIALWVAGLVLLALGVWGDSAKFWTDKPYLTNLFSALTGAAFGIPLALIVIQRITASETEAAETRAAYRMAARVSSDLAAAAEALVKGGLPEVRAAKQYLENQRAMLPHEDDFYRDAWIDVRAIIDAIEKVSIYVRSSLSQHLESDFAEISIRWSILNTESRSRLLDVNGKWLTGEEIEDLRKVIETVTEFSLENWLRQGKELLNQNRFHLGFDDPDYIFSVHKNRSPTDQLSKWLNIVIDFIDEVADLIVRARVAGGILGGPSDRK